MSFPLTRIPASLRPGLHACATGMALSVAACGSDDRIGPDPDPVLFIAPVIGTPMVDIFYGSYFDHGTGPTAIDYACGIKSFIGHRGVDILLRNFAVQDSGVTVVAAADGVVVGRDDGFGDRNTNLGAATGFGNFVVLRHADGSRTIYGHMRTNSILVELEDEITAGTPLGQVGSSGSSFWPHLHFEVRNTSNIAIDPFAGQCGRPRTRWVDQLGYQNEFMVTDAGMLATTNQPSLAALLERPAAVDTFFTDAPGLRFWIQLANQPPGTIRFEARDPDDGFAFGDGVEVTASPAMRYVNFEVPVAGIMTEPGDWQIHVFHNDEPIWVQPFTLLPSAGDVTFAARSARAVSPPHVLDPFQTLR